MFWFCCRRCKLAETISLWNVVKAFSCDNIHTAVVRSGAHFVLCVEWHCHSTTTTTTSVSAAAAAAATTTPTFQLRNCQYKFISQSRGHFQFSWDRRNEHDETRITLIRKALNKLIAKCTFFFIAKQHVLSNASPLTPPPLPSLFSRIVVTIPGWSSCSSANNLPRSEGGMTPLCPHRTTPPSTINSWHQMKYGCRLESADCWDNLFKVTDHILERRASLRVYSAMSWAVTGRWSWKVTLKAVWFPPPPPSPQPAPSVCFLVCFLFVLFLMLFYVLFSCCHCCLFCFVSEDNKYTIHDNWSCWLLSKSLWSL